MKKVVDHPALDEKGLAYPLERDVAKEAPAVLTRESLDTLECIDLG